MGNWGEDVRTTPGLTLTGGRRLTGLRSQENIQAHLEVSPVQLSAMLVR